MNFTLRGSLLILKHLHPTKLRRPGLRACSLGPRGQRWGPRHLRPDVPGDRPGAPAGTAVVGVASAASLPPFTPVIVSVHFKPTESC